MCCCEFFLLFSVDDPRENRKDDFKNTHFIARTNEKQQHQHLHIHAIQREPLKSININPKKKHFQRKQRRLDEEEKSEAQQQRDCTLVFVISHLSLGSPARPLLVTLCISFNHNPFDIYNRQTSERCGASAAHNAFYTM